jgi:hypothetical protein
MSKTDNTQLGYDINHNKIEPIDGNDGPTRYGNNRKSIAKIKVKERRRERAKLAAVDKNENFKCDEV